MARQIFFIGFVVCLLFSGKQSSAASCKTINVAPNVTLCLKNGWRPILGGKLVTLDAFGSGGQLLDNTRLSFAANYYDANNAVSAMLNLRRYPKETITQVDVVNSTNTSEGAYATVSELDQVLREVIKTELPRRGIMIVGWLGTTVDRLDGKAVFTTTYRRKSPASNAVFVVSLVRYFSGPQSFTLTLSHRENLGEGILAVINEIQESVIIR